MPRHYRKSTSTDKRSLASAIEINYKEQEDFVSSVFLGLKVCFSLLGREYRKINVFIMEPSQSINLIILGLIVVMHAGVLALRLGISLART